MSKSSWRKRSNIVIWEVLKEFDITFNTNCSYLTEAQKKAIIKAVREAYPFGKRELHPYKIWCSAVNEILGGLGIKRLTISKIRKPTKTKPKPIPKEVEGQLSLFEYSR